MSGTVLTAGTTRTQAGATLLTEEVSRVDVSTTVTSGPGDGVLLPSVGGGCPRFTVINNTLNPIQVYASGTDTINGGVGSVGITLAPQVTKTFAVASVGAWHYDSTQPARWGFVATGCGQPDSGSSLVQWMCRTRHTATDNLSLIRVLYSNKSAVGTTGTATINASIEYSAVSSVTTPTPMTWNGTSSIVLAANTEGWTDLLPVCIPKGGVFYIRTHLVQSAGNAPNCQGQGNNQNSVLGECSNGGASGITDLTTSTGTFTNSQNNIVRPTAIIGMTANASVLILGDSRADGTGDQVYDNRAGPITRYGTGDIEPALYGAGIGYCRYAVTGHQVGSVAGLSGNGDVWGNFVASQLAMYATHIINDLGINDLAGGGLTAAEVITGQAWCAALNPNARYYCCTLGPITTSTDSWATLGNQTKFAGEAQRLSYNASLRSGSLPTGAWGYFEVADQYESSRNSGLWKVNGTANYATSDGIHPSTAIYDAILAAGIIPSSTFVR